MNEEEFEENDEEEYSLPTVLEEELVEIVDEHTDSNENAPIVYNGDRHLASELQSYLYSINRIPSLSREEEFMLAKAFLEEADLDAAHKLVTSHLKLVAKIAMSYRGYGLPVMDLISEGSLGLMHAVKKFNPHLGYRLSTYAMWWIKAAMQEYILKSWSLVKIGTTASQKKLFFSLGKIKNKIRAMKNQEISDEDFDTIAEAMGMDRSEVIEMNNRLSSSDLSLNVAISEDGSGEMIDYIPDSSPSYELVLANKSENAFKHRMLVDALKTLSERELLIIQHRKLQDPPSTLDELSKELDISKERVRQIENKAFEKIQKHILARISPQ